MLLAAAPAVAAAAGAGEDWARQKCDLYAAAWQRVLETADLQDIGAEFLSAHQRFIDRGCDPEVRVCARTPPEIALADLLTVLSMNEGMASTFVPFGCPK
ncbi:MAG: hypothetical protein KDK29_08260 [Sedimentitalea sp.]|nr:hypothetical protein [Sedimentitalea sp.]